jgi:hypothetical protein
LLIGLLPGLRVDNAAHIGGLVGGFVCAYFAGEPPPPGGVPPLKERLWQYAAWGSLLLTGYAFVKMFLWMAYGQA